MQATAQQAFKWRWLSPQGIQAVALAAAPALSKAGALSPPAFVGRHAVYDNRSIASLFAVDVNTLPSQACVACGSNFNGSAHRAGSCISCAAPGNTARRRPSSARRILVHGLTQASANSTVTVGMPVDSSADDGAVKFPALVRPPGSPAALYRSQHQRPSDCTTRSPKPVASISTANTPPAAGSGLPWLQHQPGQSPIAVIPSPTLARAQLRRLAPSAEAVRRITVAATATMARSAAAATAVGPAGAGTASLLLVPTRHIVAAVDPDLGGALAIVFWDEDDQNDAAASNSAVASAPPPPPPSPSSAWQVVSTGDWLMFAPTPVAGGGGAEGSQSYAGNLAAAPAAADKGESVESGDDAGMDEAGDGQAGDDGEGGDKEGGGTVVTAFPAGELWLPAPPPPPADPSRWVVRVWDMPISAAERQKPTTAGGVSRRRLLHVAGARAVLASALAAALPPPEERRRVALYGYVEVPPILPGDGNISAYTSLWSTGAWLGLMTGMGFTVGSTPVRRWKQDLGLYGARSKDAGLALARRLFPDQARILKHKKNHGRADALLIAAWALGASLPPCLAATLRRNRMTLDELLEQRPHVAALAWGPPRPPTPTDAYGNLLTPERDMMDEIEATQSRVERLAGEREERKARKTLIATATTNRARRKTSRRKTVIAACAPGGDVADGIGIDATDVSDADAGVGSGSHHEGSGSTVAATTVRRRRSRSNKDFAAAESRMAVGLDADGGADVGGSGRVEPAAALEDSCTKRTTKRRTTKQQLAQAVGHEADVVAEAERGETDTASPSARSSGKRGASTRGQASRRAGAGAEAASELAAAAVEGAEPAPTAAATAEDVVVAAPSVAAYATKRGPQRSRAGATNAAGAVQAEAEVSHGMAVAATAAAVKEQPTLSAVPPRRRSRHAAAAAAPGDVAPEVPHAAFPDAATRGVEAQGGSGSRVQDTAVDPGAAKEKGAAVVRKRRGRKARAAVPGAVAEAAAGEALEAEAAGGGSGAGEVTVVAPRRRGRPRKALEAGAAAGGA